MVGGGASMMLPRKGTTPKVSPLSALVNTSQGFHPTRSTSVPHTFTKRAASLLRQLVQQSPWHVVKDRFVCPNIESLPRSQVKLLIICHRTQLMS